MIITDPMMVRIIGILTITLLSVALYLLLKICTEKWEKVGFAVMFSLSITSVFFAGVIQY